MQNQPIALVTGANKGIGLQIAKDLVAHGFIVLVGLPRTGSSASAIPATINTSPIPTSIQEPNWT